MAKHRSIVALAALAASCIALPALAQPGQVTSLNVTAKSPTSIVIKYNGKDVAAVRQEIRVAANTVCRNAITNGELSFVDRTWCADGTARKANRRYDVLVKASALADAGELRISVG